MSSTIFNGTSRYSQDFQSIIDRSVAIARLPASQLENQSANLQVQSGAVDSINNRVASLRTAVDGLTKALQSSANSASSSTGSVADVSVTSAALPGSYSLTVLTVGAVSSAASVETLPKVTNSSVAGISNDATLNLNVNGTAYSIRPANTSLSALADAINEQTTNSGVSASIVNLGGTAAPDYRLVLQGKQLAADSITLSDTTTGVLTSSLATGSPATYQVGGFSGVISSSSREIELAPGLKATLKQAGSTTLTVARNTAGVDSAINAFVSAYNQVSTELDKYRGKDARTLVGDPLISTVSNTLREISGFTSSGGVSNFADLGLSFDQQGSLSFDPTVLDAGASTAKSDQRNQFLNAFLSAADKAVSSLDDSTTGAIATTKSGITNSLKNNSNRVSEIDARVESLRDALTSRLSAADALIASLEQQVSYLTNLFSSQKSN